MKALPKIWTKKIRKILPYTSEFLLYLLLKFGLSENHTKFEKILLMVLTNQLIYLVNVKTMRKIFSNYVCFSKCPNFKPSNHFSLAWHLHILQVCHHNCSTSVTSSHSHKTSIEMLIQPSLKCVHLNKQTNLKVCYIFC